MRRQRARSVLTLGVMAALGAAVLAFSAVPEPVADSFVAVGSTSNSGNPGCNGKNNASCNPDTSGPVKNFGLAVGAMTGIYPTGSKPIPLTFTNPHSFDIVVETVSVAALDASPSCSESHLQRPSGVVRLASPIIVPKNGSASGPTPNSTDGQTLRVTLLNSVPDACQAPTTWPLTVTATAVKR